MGRTQLAAMSFLCIVTTIIAAAAASAETTPAPAAKTAAVRVDTIPRVEAYLSNIKSIKARFNQSAPDGSVQTGTFYLKRPGKMRWQYDEPTPVLLVSNGKTITYYDSDLGQVNYIDVDDTLASFLAKEQIIMDNEATKMVDFSAKADMIRITIEQRAKPGEGTLTLEFVDRPLQLKTMIVRDAMGAETKVQLQGAEFDVALDDSLFIFKDPRGVKLRKH